MIIIGITGASGVIYSVRLLKALKELNIKTGLIISDAAKVVIESELSESVNDIISLADKYYEFHDLTASINSGSFKFNSLVIIPCSMKSLSSIANGYSDNTITRVADVALKEHRPTIIVPRETPLRTVHIENMLSLSKEGAIILPAMPAFYSDSETIENQIDFIVGKVLDSLKIEHDIYRRWK